jgi:hypothetical protein
MRARMLFLLAALVVAAGMAVHAATPDNPGAPVPASRYAPVTSGTKSYRPVEPLPWGDINRRVSPPPAANKHSPSTVPKEKGAEPAQSGVPHKH